MAAKKQKQPKRALSALEAEQEKYRQTYRRALSGLRAGILKLAKDEAEIDSVRKLVDRAYKTHRYAVASYPSTAEGDAAFPVHEIEALCRTISEATESARRVREVQRKSALAEIDAAVEARGTQYTPGVGYTRGRRVLG